MTGLGGYAEVRREAVLLRVDGPEVAVLDLRGLIKAKRGAGRAKDLAILPLLESALLLREQRQEQSRQGL